MTYLRYFYDVSIESPLIYFLSIVHKFPDIFPTYLPIIHFEHNINFAINHDSSNLSISIIPYIMARINMKLLNIKLQYLLGKDYIRQCLLPWGALV